MAVCMYVYIKTIYFWKEERIPKQKLTVVIFFLTVYPIDILLIFITSSKERFIFQIKYCKVS